MTKNYVGQSPKKILKEVFGYDDFRLLQSDIIENVLRKNDTLAVMPTGGGKSLCYQIPSLIFDGITVVVSPLISLMQDQVDSLNETGINAVFLNSSVEWSNYLDAMNAIRRGEIKIVYVSPEGLSSSKIRDLLTEENVKVSCITIDEAHCVSEWGHDFRPDYLEISSIRNLLPNAVCLALTATATKSVRDDIIQNLQMKNPKILVSSFNRENIFLDVRPKNDTFFQTIDIINNHQNESGIIYCFSRKQVDTLTEKLLARKINALPYHAGLTDQVRAKNQTAFIRDKVQVMVATLAFGMGINKPNVRFVIHYDLPKSLEQYYQEIGRAGRDGLPSEAILFFSAGDAQKIRYFFDDSSDCEKAESLLSSMIKYASTRNCRRKTLLGYFGEHYELDDSISGEKKSNCCCDVCRLGPIPLVDMTIPSQKFLSCVIRTKSRFGAAYIADVLTGSSNKRIVENGHDKISTYNIGQELKKSEWLKLCELLIDDGYLNKSAEYSVLSLTADGVKALQNRDKFMLPFILKSTSAKNTITSSTGKSSNYENSFDGTTSTIKRLEKPRAILHKKLKEIELNLVEQKLLNALKKWRKDTADKHDVPPFVIFGDKTLSDIIQKKPTTMVELKNIYGIGDQKAKNFGQDIIRVIKNNIE